MNVNDTNALHNKIFSENGKNLCCWNLYYAMDKVSTP